VNIGVSMMTIMTYTPMAYSLQVIINLDGQRFGGSLILSHKEAFIVNEGY